MADNLHKQPSKGILKNSSSFDSQDVPHPSRGHRHSIKGATFDEMNIIATYHPANKEYGHMKIDEPKTPYNYEILDGTDGAPVLDPNVLAEKIKAGAAKPPKAMESESEEEESDEDLSPEEKAKKKEFEAKRKKHYNEFYAIQIAKKLLEEDEDDDDNKGESTGESSETK